MGDVIVNQKKQLILDNSGLSQALKKAIGGTSLASIYDWVGSPTIWAVDMTSLQMMTRWGLKSL